MSLPLSFGALCQELRLSRGCSLRDFCERHQFDPVYLSGVERDKRPAPEDFDELRQLSSALGLDGGGEKLAQFRQLAAESVAKFASGQLPLVAPLEYQPALVPPGVNALALADWAKINDDFRDGRRLRTWFNHSA